MTEKLTGFRGILEGFNRKERNLLVREILGHRQTSLSLSKAFRGQIDGKIHSSLAADAWWATDFHIDWLVAAVMILSGQTKPEKLHERRIGLTTATQEDFDLVLADDRHLILVEAKAHGAWDQAQFDRKFERFKQIRGLAPEHLEVRLLLLSPVVSEGLKIPDGFGIEWLSFDIGTSLTSYRVTRCDANGKPGIEGDHWKVVETAATEPTKPSEF